MQDVNKMILIGRLGQDPIQRETKTGTLLVTFSLATSRRWRDEEAGDPESGKKEETQWHRIVAWGKQGEFCLQYLKKGYSVYVEGSTRSRKYTTKEGESRWSYDVHVERVNILGRPLAMLTENISLAQEEPVAAAG